jgi:hypothetical protein
VVVVLALPGTLVGPLDPGQQLGIDISDAGEVDFRNPPQATTF